MVEINHEKTTESSVTSGDPQSGLIQARLDAYEKHAASNCQKPSPCAEQEGYLIVPNLAQRSPNDGYHVSNDAYPTNTPAAEGQRPQPNPMNGQSYANPDGGSIDSLETMKGKSKDPLVAGFIEGLQDRFDELNVSSQTKNLLPLDKNRDHY